MPAGNLKNYFQDRLGSILLNPSLVTVEAVITASGATITKTTTGRRSDPDTTVAGSAGTYTLANLPRGRAYIPLKPHTNPGTGTQLVCDANIGVFDASAGTMTILIRNSSTGAVAAPPDNTILYIQFLVEEG